MTNKFLCRQNNQYYMQWMTHSFVLQIYNILQLFFHSAIWKKKHFSFWDIKVFPSSFTFSCPPWMYQDGALYSWICSKHILANMITSKNEKFHFFQTHSIVSNYPPPRPHRLKNGGSTLAKLDRGKWKWVQACQRMARLFPLRLLYLFLILQPTTIGGVWEQLQFVSL